MLPIGFFLYCKIIIYILFTNTAKVTSRRGYQQNHLLTVERKWVKQQKLQECGTDQKSGDLNRIILMDVYTVLLKLIQWGINQDKPHDKASVQFFAIV